MNDLDMFLYRLIQNSLVGLFIKLEFYVGRSYLTFDKGSKGTLNALKLLKNRIKKCELS